MGSEMCIRDSFPQKNNTFKPVRRPAIQPKHVRRTMHTQRVMNSKWVFRRKKNKDGLVTRFKARWTIVGTSMKPGADFYDSYAPVVKHSTFRSCMAIGIEEDLVAEAADVRTAFLYGRLELEPGSEDRTLLAELPQGLTDLFTQEELQKAFSLADEIIDRQSWVAQLLAAIYGTRNGANLWFVRWTILLSRLGFVVSRLDPCLYYGNKHKDPMHITAGIHRITFSVDDVTA